MMGMRMTLLLRLIKYPALSTVVNARGEHLLEMLIGEFIQNSKYLVAVTEFRSTVCM